MFVGEAPGEDEDKQGEPFVGRAGQLLTKIIEAIGLTRDQVYIANVIKCRPPATGTRAGRSGGVRAVPVQQIASSARVIVALGKFAAQCLLRSAEPITRLRGREFEYRGATLIPTFHPAYLLRNPPASARCGGHEEGPRDPRRRPAPVGHSMRLISVAVPVPALGLLTYAVPERLADAPVGGVSWCRSARGRSPGSCSATPSRSMRRWTCGRSSTCSTPRRSCR